MLTDLPNLVGVPKKAKKVVNVELSTTETYKDIIPAASAKHFGLCQYYAVAIIFVPCIVPCPGRERSRDVTSILNEVRDLQMRGYKEVTLLGKRQFVQF